MQCFRCGYQLEKSLFKRKIHYLCPKCRARMISIAALRNLEAECGMVAKLWRASEVYFGENDSLCRICGKKLRQIKIQPSENEKFEIDICRSCQIFWFDEGELEKLPLRDITVQVPKNAPNKSINMSEPMELPQNMPAVRGDDESFADFMLAAMGVPIIKDYGILQKVPLLTLLITLICAAALGIECYYGFDSCINSWGFIPAEPFRNCGSTILTSAFLHASFYHFISNIYFFWLTGKLLEQVFSLKKMVLLFFISLLISKTVYALTATNINIPCVGASGFIAGFMGCCAVCFPTQKLSFLCRSTNGLSTKPLWFELPFWFIFSAWFILQVALTFFHGTNHVAFTSHIGGGIAGVFCGTLFRYHHLLQKYLHNKRQVCGTQNQLCTLNNFRNQEREND